MGTGNVVSWAGILLANAMPRTGFYAVLFISITIGGSLVHAQVLSDTLLPFAPRSYVCYRTVRPLHIDGRLTEDAWQEVPWTEDFVDIVGPSRPLPPLRTRVKMLWDDTYLYIGAELEEPHLWGRLSQRDTVIFYDNDFEVFIDPDGDTHQYYELEINARGTVWDLFLVKPYRDGGPALHAWDMRGLRAAVALQGTLNDPSDRDTGWTVELALPWDILKEAAPQRRRPQAGDTWRINFSRVQWHLEVVNDTYRKRRDPRTGKPLPEENWVWSPQGAVNMHMPERWGYVQFSSVMAGQGTEAFRPDPYREITWLLRKLYYRQYTFYRQMGRYARSWSELGVRPPASLRLQTTDSMYEIVAVLPEGVQWHIRQDGRLWKTRHQPKKP